MSQSQQRTPQFESTKPLRLNDPDFVRHKFDAYRWMLEAAPVCDARLSLMRLKLVARYEDCRMVLSDERFVRNRGRAMGKPSGSPFPFPLPRSIAAIGRSMIVEDDPEHRRLRNLVNKTFTSRAIEGLSPRIEESAGQLLDGIEKNIGEVDLLEAYARPIPTRVIADMVGLERFEVEEFDRCLSILTTGLTGFGILRTILWDLRQADRFVRRIVARKRREPGNDILTALIDAEEDGDRLGEDELVAMVFLLIIGGFETTQHLITNGVIALLENPDQLERLRSDATLLESAVDEIVRHRGPLHGTKLQYATRDVKLHGVTISRGTAVMPMLGAANHDPRVFPNPDVFDITRTPNYHLGFGFGMHFCLGKQLALMETRIALKHLIERCPDLRLAVDSSQLEIANVPGWHRHKRLPVRLR